MMASEEPARSERDGGLSAANLRRMPAGFREPPAGRSLHNSSTPDKLLSELDEAKLRMERMGYIDPSTCPHADTTIRAKQDALWRVRYERQCTQCGKSVSSAIKRQEVERLCGLIERVEPWDKELANYANHYFSVFRREVENIRRERNSEWWDWYSDYLQSDEWKKRRALVLQRSRGTCEGCMRAAATQVHHLTYNNVGNELLWELVAVCDDCHDRVHPELEEAYRIDEAPHLINGAPGSDVPF